MSDRRLATLERRWHASGAEEDRRVYIRELLRCGCIEQLPAARPVTYFYDPGKGDRERDRWNYDWHHVFERSDSSANNPGACQNPGIVPPLAQMDGSGFTVADVEKIVAIDEKQEDGWSGTALVLLRDGRWATIFGWCDYTGWG